MRALNSEPGRKEKNVPREQGHYPPLVFVFEN
jgi:hypothetical protein